MIQFGYICCEVTRSEQARRGRLGGLCGGRGGGGHGEAEERRRREGELGSSEGINQSSLLLVYIDFAVPLGFHGQCAFMHFAWVDEGACLA